VTPAYASCQRLSGELPDVSDDIFSFACLAYELLSGRHPYDRRSALVARDEGSKPRRIRGLPRRQWRALKSALAWEREQRPASMQDLLYDLVLHADAQERGARQPSGGAGLWVRAAMAAALVVLAAAAALTWNRWPADLRDNVGERLVATGDSLTQAVEAAGVWVTERLSAPGSDRGSATSVPGTAPGAAPAIESSPAAASPSTAAPLPLPPADLPNDGSDDVAAAPLTYSPANQAPVPAHQMAVAADQATAPPAPAAQPAPVDDAEAGDVAPAPASPAGDGPGTLEFSSDSVSVGESGSVARVKVRRRGGAAGEVSFDWATVDDSAIAGEDYAPATVREVMVDGQTGATLLIPIVADSVVEQTELFDVVIQDVSGAELGSLTHMPVIIVDDD
jgi:hypothetical protein